MQLQRGQARLDDDVVLEIEDPLEILQRHVEQQADAARQRLQEPDMRHRRGQLDMAHAVAPHLRQRHLDAALLADDAAILHALVLAAQALVILDRAEDAGAEQPVPLRLEGAVVDRLGLLDLAVRPGADALRAGDRDADLVEALRPRDLPEDVHQLIHRGPLSRSVVMPAKAGIQGRPASRLRPWTPAFAGVTETQNHQQDGVAAPRLPANTGDLQAISSCAAPARR